MNANSVKLGKGQEEDGEDKGKNLLTTIQIK